MPTPTTSSRIAKVVPSNSIYIDALLSGWRWDSPNVTFSFAAAGSFWSFDAYGDRTPGREPWSSLYSPLSASDRPAFYASLLMWGVSSKLEFAEITETQFQVGDIRAAYTYVQAQGSAVAWAYFPNESPAGGDIWFNALNNSGFSVWDKGSYAHFTVLHELGHALGLKHSFDGATTLPAQYDSQIFTIMSYSALPGDRGSTLSYFPTTPMVLDVQAIQYMYGADYSFNGGGSMYSYNDSQRYMETIWDGGGNDTIAYTGFHRAEIDLRQGFGSKIGTAVIATFSSGATSEVNNVWIAFGTDIENAVGGRGNDVLHGNALSNGLTGGAGNDTIDGDNGIDYAYFSGEASQYAIKRNTDGSINLSGPDGFDTLFNVERIQIGSAKVALDVEGHAGQAYRLYKAAFDRTPDLGGLGYQMGALDQGFSLAQVATAFLASPEFQTKYGNVDNTQFVTLLYRNVLDREPDAGGLAYHLNDLAHGVTRAQILSNFSESPENQANVIGLIANGMVYTV